MQIYEIDYSLFVDTRTEEEISVPESKPHLQEIEMNIHFGASEISEALELAIGFLNEAFGRGFKIQSVSALEGVEVANWPDEHEECDCPFCVAERSAEEDVMTFDCSCGERIRVVDGWTKIQCPHCLRTIERNKVMGSNGIYILIDLEKK